jgi:adenylyl cyclase-associated protein
VLTWIYPRLEAATSRLEDIATSVDGSSPLPNGAPAAVAAAGAGAAAGAAATTSAAPPPPPTPAEPLPRSIEDFDKVIEEDVNAFVTASNKIGGLVEEQARLSWQISSHRADMC